MIRESKGIWRSLTTIAVLAFALGCPGDDPKNPGQNVQSPTGPFAGIAITIGANPQRLEVGDDTRTSRIAVEAFHTANWAPVANGTEAIFTATLGAIDSPTGARAATVTMFDGKAEITLFPGTTSGTARITVNIGGAVATVNVAIDPDPTGGEPPIPAPTASTLTLTGSPSTLSEEVAQDGAGPQSVMLTATVLGSDGKPFKGAGIFFTTPLGTFSNLDATSAIFKTNSAGQVIEFLSVEDAALLAFGGSSFQVTAHLGIEGGEKTTTVTITIVAGPPPATASKVTLTTDTTFVNDDGVTGAVVGLTATVQDQNQQLLAGAIVTFSSTLGNPSPVTASSDVAGEADSTLTLSALDIANHPTNSFTVTASLNGATPSTKVITIVRPPAADFTFSGPTGFVVNFSNQSANGCATCNSWDFDSTGTPGLNISSAVSPTFDFTTLGAGTYDVLLTVTNSAGSDSVTKSVTVPLP